MSAATPVSSASTSAAVGRGGDAEHGPAVGAELGDGRGEGGGLAGAGRADDEHEIGVPATAPAASAWAAFSSMRLRVAGGWFVGAVVGEATVGPGDEGGFLVEDRLGGERPVDGRFGDGRPSRRSSAPGGIGRDTSTQRGDRHLLDELVDPVDQPVGVERGRRSGRRRRARGCSSVGRHVDCRSAMRDHRLVDDRARRRPGRCRGVRPADRSPCRPRRPGRARAAATWCGPSRVQLGGVDGWALAGRLSSDGFAFEPPPFPRRRFPAHRVDRTGRACRRSGGRTSAVRVENSTSTSSGTSRDLGDAVLGFVPADAEPAGQLGSQPGVVERRQGALVDA